MILSYCYFSQSKKCGKALNITTSYFDLNDITHLEIIPVAVTIFFWKERFEAKHILFHCDNLAVVTILNSKTSKSERVMSS
jgi:hypothetical protein